jgi:hypothetical protein
MQTMTTFAQKLWRDEVKTGRQSEREAFRGFCTAVKEEDIDRQVDSMSEEMFAALRKFLQPTTSASGELEWPEDALGITTHEAHAFNFDFEKASLWKRKRLEKIYAAIQKLAIHRKP